MANVRALYGDKLVYCDRPYGALEGADGLAIVTEWQEFRNPDFEVMRRLLREHGHLRRPQPLRAEDAGRLRLHLLLHRPQDEPARRGRTGRVTTRLQLAFHALFFAIEPDRRGRHSSSRSRSTNRPTPHAFFHSSYRS